VPKWSDFSSIWSTLREIDVSGIREEAERPLFIALVGSSAANASVAALLRSQVERFPPVGLDPLVPYTLPLPPEAIGELRRADLLVIALDSDLQRGADGRDSLREVAAVGLPTLVVLLGAEATNAGLAAARLPGLHSVQLADAQAPDAATTLAAAVLERLPEGLHLSAARHLPALRAEVAQALIAQTSFSNATYALASGIPEQIPILSIPFAAADILVLTKNQALLVYKLALALGAPPDFQARIAEVLPVIGGAYVWRQLARTLIGLVPVWGLLPKVAIAYAGTYTTGVAAWQWYAKGELVSGQRLRRISQEAMQLGRARAREMIETAGAGGQRLRDRIRAVLPSGRKASNSMTPQLPPPEDTST
jgi:uncharacterized protein (DUF697 family)